jgi:hypothetical protein
MRGPRKNPAVGRAVRPVSGSVLFELALAIVVFALAIWLIVDVVGWFQQQRRNARLIEELRAIEVVFETSPPMTASRVGAAPPRVPAALEEALKSTRWYEGSAVGGTFEWVPPGELGGERGAIGVTAFAPAFPLGLSRADLLAIDRELDDGDLATGRFRTGFNGWPVYRLNRKR